MLSPLPSQRCNKSHIAAAPVTHRLVHSHAYFRSWQLAERTLAWGEVEVRAASAACARTASLDGSPPLRIMHPARVSCHDAPENCWATAAFNPLWTSDHQVHPDNPRAFGPVRNSAPSWWSSFGIWTSTSPLLGALIAAGTEGRRGLGVDQRLQASANQFGEHTSRIGIKLRADFKRVIADLCAASLARFIGYGADHVCDRAPQFAR
jgi:hypothetical protein